MARIRSIKPEFWSDEKLSECSLSARLTFIGLWTFADDEGRLDFQPSRLRMQVYPCGTVSIEQLREYLGELTERSLIRFYEVDGREYLDIPNFTKHQKINRPTPSKLPKFSRKAHGVLTEDSLPEGRGREGIWRGGESSGKEGRGEARPVDNSAGNGRLNGRKPEDFSGENAPPEEPSSRRGVSAERKNGNFEEILEAVTKVLAAGGVKAGEYQRIGDMAGITPLQAEVAIRQLRDRGRLPGVAA